MSLEFYKVLHVFGLSFLFSGFGAAIALKMAGTPFQGKPKTFAFLTHGIGLVLMLISGFGMLAKLGTVGGFPGWAFGKLGLWLLLGGSISLAKRRGEIGWPLIIFFSGLAATGAFLALFKPF